jgi:fermentation-respiration switch protein FrsA (DUF1100 family)
MLASPCERVPLGVEQLVLHGDRDETLALAVSESYAVAALEAGDPCVLRLLPGTGHFEHIDPSTDAWQIGRDWLLERLEA